MATLTSAQQSFIVVRLACYDTPSEVAAALMAEWPDAQVSRQQVQNYDPTRRAGAKLSKHWRDMFFQARERFLAQVEDVPIANKAVRLRRLEQMAETARDRGNYILAANLIEQAAKEMGDAYTNTRKLANPDGSAIDPAALAVPVSLRFVQPDGSTIPAKPDSDAAT